MYQKNPFKNLKRFGPKLSFKFNRYIPTKNYTLTHFTGDHENMISFATHVQQLTLGSRFCNSKIIIFMQNITHILMILKLKIKI